LSQLIAVIDRVSCARSRLQIASIAWLGHARSASEELTTHWLRPDTRHALIATL